MMKLQLDETDLAEQWKDLMPDSVRFEHFKQGVRAIIIFMNGATFSYRDENLEDLTQYIAIEVPNQHVVKFDVDTVKVEIKDTKVAVDFDALETKVIAAAAHDEQCSWREGDSMEQRAQVAAAEGVAVGKFNSGKAKIQAVKRHEKRAAKIFGCNVCYITDEQIEWARNVAFGEAYGRTARLPCGVCCGHGCCVCSETGFDANTLTSEDFGHHPSAAASTRAKEKMMYFFGCSNNEKGHYLFKDEPGGYLAAVRGIEDRRMSWTTICDMGLLNKDAKQVEGEGTYSYLKGYSVISFWDRSVDGRSNSNASFLTEGHVTFKALLLAARVKFPKVFERFNFEIIEVEFD